MYEPVQDGRSRSLYWVADDHGRFVAKAYYLSLSDRERAALDVVITRLANDDVEGEERFCTENGSLWRIAGGRHRLLCFESGPDLMIASGYEVRRAGQRLRDEAVEVAMHICHNHVNAGE